MSFSKRSYTPESKVDLRNVLPPPLKQRLKSPLLVPKPILESVDLENSVGSCWSGSTAFIPLLPDPFKENPCSASSAHSKWSPTSNNNSKSNAIPCSSEGCDWLGKTLYEHRLHTALHKLEPVCPVANCATKGKGFATINDRNCHLKAAHGTMNALWSRLGHGLGQARSRGRPPEEKADPSVAGSKKDYESSCDTTKSKPWNPVDVDASYISTLPIRRGLPSLHMPNPTTSGEPGRTVLDEGYGSLNPSRSPGVDEKGSPLAWLFPQPSGRNEDDWVQPHGSLTMEMLRQCRNQGLYSGEDLSARGTCSTDSEESTSMAGESLDLSESGLTLGNNPSTRSRQQALREQMDVAEFTISQGGLVLKEMDTEYAPAIASISAPLRHSRNLLPLSARGRSTSQSSKIGSNDSDGEREFMGIAIDRGTVGELAPSFAAAGDYDLITKIVTQLVQAYLQTLDYPTKGLRQCADGNGISQSQRTAGDNSSLPISQNSAPKASARNCKRARQEDDDDDLEEQDNPVKRAKLVVDGSENKSFACPYSKHERARYSEMNRNTCEKKYRCCASSYVTDIPRLKQHLFRTHKRPDLYCGRCFGVFKTQHDLEEHSRLHPPCPLDDCPFSEKMTHDQKMIIQRRRDLKDQELVWFFIYETLFPGSIKPSSPYVEVVSIEAAASFQQWYESPDIVFRFRQRFDSRIAEAFPDTSDQFRIQMIHEECLSELVWQRGSNFHITTGDEGMVDFLELPEILPSSSGVGPSYGTAGLTPWIGAGSTTNSLAMQPEQSGITEPQFAFLGSGGVVPRRNGNQEMDIRMQESLPTLGVSSHSTPEIIEELDKPPPHDHMQDLFDFSMMESSYTSDLRAFSGNDILTINTADAEDFNEAGVGDQIEDGLSGKQKGKRRA